MVSQWPRHVLHRAANWLSARTDLNPWRAAGTDSYSVDVGRRRPVVFPSADMLGAFMESLPGEATTVALADLPPVDVRAPFDEIARKVSHAAPGDRARISFSGTTPDGAGHELRWLVEFSTVSEFRTFVERPIGFVRVFVSAGGGAADGLAASLKGSVSRFTVEPKRCRRGAPLVEPITMEDGLQREHDAAIARRSARVGGWWGALGGAIGGGAVTAAVEFLLR